jgi:hypothetical protein
MTGSQAKGRILDKSVSEDFLGRKREWFEVKVEG